MPRNGSGTYSLPTGNPVVSGTTIEASWANNTMSDIGNEITNSLSRTGAGGMTGAFRAANGTSTVPGIAWSSETSTGFYRAGAADMRLVVTTTEVQKWLSTGTTITGTLAASGDFAIATNKFTVAAASGNTVVGGTLGASGDVSFDGGTFVFNESGADKDARFEGDTDANLLFTDASTDRVGIGSNAPAYKLDVVVGTSGDGIYLQRAGNQKFSALGDGTVNWSAGSDGGKLSWDTGKAIVTSNSGATLAFRTNATTTDRILIDTSGNVGIGQTSPGSTLDVKGTLRLSGSSSGYVGLAPAAAAGSTTYTLPSADGTNGYFLSTNGSGTLSWASASVTQIDNVTYLSQTLTDGVTINWDLNNGVIATVTLGGNRTIAAPTNRKVGTYILHVIQDGSGNRTLSWNSVFKWTAAVAPTLTTTAGARDVFSFICDGTNFYGSFMPDVR